TATRQSFFSKLSRASDLSWERTDRQSAELADGQRLLANSEFNERPLLMSARTSQITQVGKRKIELSNLSKVLYPDDQIIKAQLIEYYFRIAPTILAQVKG